jgi:ribosomal protein S18 acetylase RimI-like enzyme
MDAQRPEKRHVYLSLIGSLPEYRGQGLASALLDAGLSRWDRQGMPTNLMSTNGDNLPFYESRGYEVIAEAVLPDGGPRLWDMWREPR